MALSFSIITPSFRQLEWLKLCAKSIEDQKADVELEHIIQDAGTGPELEEWITKNTSAKLFVEKDNGMYDAVNRGLRRASGDILAYLNCDEQYLPGALRAVQEYFEANPLVDMVIGGFIIINKDGEFLAARKGIIPLKNHTLLCHLAAATCTIFFRKKLICHPYNIFFNSELKDISDVLWMLDCLRQKVKISVLQKFTSAFAITGENRNQLPNAKREKTLLLSKVPAYMKALRPAIQMHHLFRKLIYGAYNLKPFTYSVYSHSSITQRTFFRIDKPTFSWPKELD